MRCRSDSAAGFGGMCTEAGTVVPEVEVKKKIYPWQRKVKQAVERVSVGAYCGVGVKGNWRGPRCTSPRARTFSPSAADGTRRWYLACQLERDGRVGSGAVTEAKGAKKVSTF